MKVLSLHIEFAILYVLLPVLLRALHTTVPVFLVLWLAALVALLALLRDPAFDRTLLTAWRGTPGTFRSLAWRLLISTALVAILVRLLLPHAWLAFPRQKPVTWLLVLLLYPPLSVLPQGVLYRTLFYHRYASLFGGTRRARAVGALAFAWCHLVFDNYWAVCLSLLGGWFFCGTYERTRSGPAANTEHALYGGMIFTTGLGIFFYLGRRIF